MFKAYLWKEWRENRWMLLSQSGLVLLVPALGWLLLAPRGWWLPRTPSCALVPPMAAMLLALIVYVPDLGPKEKRGRGMDLIRRMPSGLNPAFSAKLVFLLSVVFLYTALGTISFLFNGVEFDVDPDLNASNGEMLIAFVLLFLLTVSLSLWGFTISTWIRCGTLVLPALGLMVAIWWGPYLKQWSPTWFKYGFLQKGHSLWSHDLSPFPPAWDQFLLFVLILLPPLAAAWLSFSALRLSDRPNRPSLVGAPFLAIAMLCTCGWVSLNKDSWTVSPADRDFRITGALIGEGGSYAFVNADGRGVHCGAIVDLRNGQYEQPPHADWRVLREYDPGKFALAWLHCCERLEASADYAFSYDGDFSTFTVFCGRSANSLGNPLTTPSEFAVDFNKPTYVGSLSCHYLIDIWDPVLSKRPELANASEPHHLYGDLWLLTRNMEDAKKWMLYDAAKRSFFPCPLSEEPYQAIGRFCSGAFSTHGNDNHITGLQPFPGKWYVERQNQNRCWIQSWDPATRKYDDFLHLEDAQLYGSSWSYAKDWFIAHKYVDELEATFLINRSTGDYHSLDAIFATAIYQTPAGKLVIIARDGSNRSLGVFMLFDPHSKCVECEFQSQLAYHFDYFPENAAPDDETVYIGTFKSEPSKCNLVHVDFKAKTARVVFPPQRGASP